MTCTCARGGSRDTTRPLGSEGGGRQFPAEGLRGTVEWSNNVRSGCVEDPALCLRERKSRLDIAAPFQQMPHGEKGGSPAGRQNQGL